MKNYKVLGIVNVILIVYIFTMSVGYALFSESLTINGVATTVDYYSGDNLPVEAIVRNTDNNYYFTSDFDSGYLVSVESENWQDDTYTLNIDKSMLASLEGQTITYTISFTNPTVLNYTDGVITTEVIGDDSDISLTSGELSQTEVVSTGTGDISFSITVDTFNESDSAAKATIAYTYQNKPRYLYFVVNYLANGAYENLFNQEALLTNTTVTKTSAGYSFAGYGTSWGSTSTLVTDLKSKLQAGITYELIRDYQGTVNASNGRITLRNESGVIVTSPIGVGIKKLTFTLTQEQIDSLSTIYIYGANDGTGLFKYIIIREAK